MTLPGSRCQSFYSSLGRITKAAGFMSLTGLSSVHLQNMIAIMSYLGNISC